MHKQEVINAVAEVVKQPKVLVKEVLDGFYDVVTSELVAGGEVSMTGVGKFTAKYRDARKARNPRTGDTVNVAARMVPKFTAAKQLKEALAGSKIKATAKKKVAAPAKAPIKKTAAKPVEAAPRKRAATTPTRTATTHRAAAPAAAAPKRRVMR
jgi:DNA-binding protein HU-beta